MIRKIFSEKLRNGFTLIELLVVIAIIAILAVTAITVYNSARKSATDSKRQQIVKQISDSLQMYLTANNDVFPTGAANTTTWLHSVLYPTYLNATKAQMDDAAGTISNIAADGNNYCIVSKEALAKPGTYYYAQDGATGTNTANACP